LVGAVLLQEVIRARSSARALGVRRVQLERRADVASWLLGVPVAEIVDQVLELDTVLGLEAHRIVEQIGEAADDQGRAATPRRATALARGLATATSWLQARAGSARGLGTAHDRPSRRPGWSQRRHGARLVSMGPPTLRVSAPGTRAISRPKDGDWVPSQYSTRSAPGTPPGC
jgi:hypothetical protein